jgi:hypothetical protein
VWNSVTNTDRYYDSNGHPYADSYANCDSNSYSHAHTYTYGSS